MAQAKWSLIEKAPSATPSPPGSYGRTEFAKTLKAIIELSVIIVSSKVAVILAVRQKRIVVTR
ncbi:hypothetical protein BT69DRAFT_1359167 [Atractiella rhizophila]|nr:hypothetical protein BT69DRAFT_1359167 [Atractiella rhizophila]